MVNDEVDDRLYRVVVNHEEQYSIWLADRDIPLGWQDVGKIGTKEECLSYIGDVWTDMRPLSLRTKMEEVSPSWEKTNAVVEGTTSRHETRRIETSEEDNLVDRLCQGVHPVEIRLGTEKRSQALRDSLQSKFVHLRFTNTKGGTELVVKLDAAASDLDRAFSEGSTGRIRLVGTLTLDYVSVRCIADVDLHDLRGHGYLERLEE